MVSHALSFLQRSLHYLCTLCKWAGLQPFQEISVGYLLPCVVAVVVAIIVMLVFVVAPIIVIVFVIIIMLILI